MKRNWISFVNVMTILVLLLTLAASPAALAASSMQTGSPISYMPPNPEKIAAALIARGVIPANATPQQKEAAVATYLKNKLSNNMDRGYNPLARKQVDTNEAYLNLNSNSNIHGRKLGNTISVPPSEPQFKAVDEHGKLLLILVEFSDVPYTWQPVEGPERTEAGPLHNQIPAPENSFDLYVPDFSTQHYEDMLFTPGGWTFPANSRRYAGETRGSMHDYYQEQSYGKYSINGKAYGWFTVDKPEAYYGDDRPNGSGDDLMPGLTRDLIADAVDVINAQNAINWEDYDTDHNCTIDHPLFIHAGIDQSGGGGAQGDDAIWAHSSSVMLQVAVTPGCPEGIYIYNYTIMPEDGGVGVFAHEFGHDLGLPDEYDTIYSGRGDSVAFWSLMSSGSWVGKPAQTQPSDISIWGKYALGWVTPENMVTASFGDLSTTSIKVRLEQAERWGGASTNNAVRINLPPKAYFINTPHSGVWEWFGGKANDIDTSLRRAVDLTGKTSVSLSFWTWYDIEEFWDFGFVQVSTDGGVTWASLPIAGTTSTIDPQGKLEIAANLPGFTGSSDGWQQKTADLSAYLGQNILLQFRYMTDAATTMAGFYVDDISVTADGAALFSDSVETLDPAWTAVGWTHEAGSGVKAHYYMLEWRNIKPFVTPAGGASIVNFDAGLSHVYQFDTYGSTGNINEPWYFSYNPGLLLWYRDMTFTDNWTGVHPGSGFLLVVDAHPSPMLRPPYPDLKYGSLPWNNRVQVYDATFSLTKALNAKLGYWGITRTYSGMNAVPNFADSTRYWSSKAPDNSVITLKYGLKFRVMGQAKDGSAAVVGIGK